MRKLGPGTVNLLCELARPKEAEVKKGFARQKDAKEFERKFLEQFAKNPDITFEALYLKYKEYIRLRIRESTAASRFSMIERHILPFFKDKIVSEINLQILPLGRMKCCKKD